MALDSRFVIASDLQSLFRDKDTGLPLRNGVVYFWKDQACSEPKDVFKLSGSPPNYNYTNIGNEITLTAAGTMSDNENPANDIVLYYFPYEDTPDEANTTVELYYVEVYSEGGKELGVLQFTREAWPNVADAESASQNLQNYIPNGQFKIHTNIPADNSVNPPLVAGEIRQAVTDLAQGGWTFERPNASVAKDIVLFEEFGSYVENPTASPQFFIQIQNQSPAAGDGYKDLRIRFDDVNKFASSTKEYTFAFWGESNSGSVNVSLILIKNYGVGGDATEEIPIANFIITNSFNVIQKSGFVFGDNTGKTIGADSFVQLALRFPAGSLFSTNLTNFILTPGSIIVDEFPQTTDREFSTQSVTPAIPDYDSLDLYLPVRLSPQGLIYDSSEIGEVIAESNISTYVNSLHPTSNKLLADGSQYETLGFSPLGIPFARLQSKYWNNTLNLPIYGTGSSYFLAVLVASSNQFILTNNSPGIATPSADGSIPTGFTFTTTYTGIAPASGYFCKVVQPSSDTIYIINNEPGDVGSPLAGTAPVVAAIARNGTATIKQISSIQITGPVGAGEFFEFQTSNGGAVNYYLWYKISGAGSDPAIGGRTGILVDVNSGDSISVVAQKTRAAINNCQTSAINTIAASGITAGSFFTANAITPGGASLEYYVWYKKDGAGTDPAPSGRTGILVNILSADTNLQVAQKTQIAINEKFFAVPDYRGLFFRGWNSGNGIDPDAAERYSNTIGIIGDEIGTQEFDDILQHQHSVTYDIPNFTTSQAGGGAVIDVGAGVSPVTENTTLTGGAESRPINIYVNYAIRY